MPPVPPLRRRRWSACLLSYAAAVTLVVATSSLFLSGLTHTGTEELISRTSGRVAYVSTPDTYADDDPGAIDNGNLYFILYMPDGSFL